MASDELDSQDMLGIVDSFSSQVEEASGMGRGIKARSDISSVVVTGMGGSGHPGDMLKAYFQSIGSKTPVFVVRDYALPEFVGSSTLVFAISYSGNTEETLSSFKAALRKGARVVVVTSGGKLRQLAEQANVPVVIVPSGVQPRLALGYLFFPLLNVLSASGIIKDVSGEVSHVVSALRKSRGKEQARSLADKATGKVPLIYSSSSMGIAAYVWKILVNECSKTHAFSNVFPEMNHNEINAFKNLPCDFYAVFLEDEMDTDRVRARMEISRDIISKSGVESAQVVLKGESFLVKLFVAIHTGMYFSYFLALIYKTDPTPVPVIEELKGRLARRFRG